MFISTFAQSFEPKYATFFRHDGTRRHGFVINKIFQTSQVSGTADLGNDITYNRNSATMKYEIAFDLSALRPLASDLDTENLLNILSCLLPYKDN